MLPLIIALPDYYNATENSFTNPVVHGPLAILKDGDQGDNGAFIYGEGYPEMDLMLPIIGST